MKEKQKKAPPAPKGKSARRAAQNARTDRNRLFKKQRRTRRQQALDSARRVSGIVIQHNEETPTNYVRCNHPHCHEHGKWILRFDEPQINALGTFLRDAEGEVVTRLRTLRLCQAHKQAFIVPKGSKNLEALNTVPGTYSALIQGMPPFVGSRSDVYKQLRAQGISARYIR